MEHAVDLAHSSDVDAYLWCYTERERDLYTRWGFELLEEAHFYGDPAYVMVSRRPTHPVHHIRAHL